MSKIVFRNYDQKAIEDLMWEIGKERVRAAIFASGMENRPLTMDGFYVEFQPENKDFILFYMYPSRTRFQLMSVLGFWRIPDKGWVKEWT